MQGQGLSNIIATGAHVRGAPAGQNNGLQPLPFILKMPLHEPLRRQFADIPRCFRRHRAHIDRKEIPARRQNIRSPPRWAPEGPGGTNRPESPAADFAFPLAHRQSIAWLRSVLIQSNTAFEALKLSDRSALRPPSLLQAAQYARQHPHNGAKAHRFALPKYRDVCRPMVWQNHNQAGRKILLRQ